LQHVLLCCSMFYCVATCCIAVGAAPLCFGAQVLQLLIKKRKRNMDGSLLGSNAAARMVCSGPCSYTLPFYMYTLPASAAGPHSCNLVRHAATSCTIPLQPYCMDFVREKQVLRLTLRQPRLQSATTHQGLIAAECGAADRRQMTSDASNAPYRANCARRAGVAVGMRLSAANGQNGTQPHDVPSAECWIILCCTTLSKCCTGGTAR
jgi:hypothetical protein